MVYTRVSKTRGRKTVRVRLPPSAPKKMEQYKLNSWTPELAYAIGLITTDGNLSSDGRHISLTSSDQQLLRTFRKCLNLKNKIAKNPNGSYSKRQCYRIQFGNILFYKWLTKIGLMPCKTSRLREICIPDRFLRDFLRGHLDGDGSIIIYEDRYNISKNPKYIYKRLYVNFISSSPRHISWIYQKLNKILDIIGGISSYTKNGCGKNAKTMWKLCFAKKASLKLLSWLYYQPGLPCLNRKREIAERALKKRKVRPGKSLPQPI